MDLSFNLFAFLSIYAQNPLGTFLRRFPVDGEVANLFWTC